MSNEVATRDENTGLSLDTVAGRIAATGITAKDIAPTRLHLMQPSSGMVGDEQAKCGDIVNTMTNEILGGNGKPIEIIPIELYKTIVTEDASVKPPKFIKQEPATAALEELPWEDKDKDGKPIKRTLCFNFFALLAAEVESDDATPVVIRFKVSSLKAGKALATHLFKRAALGQLSYSKAVELDSNKQKKENNTYAVYSIGKPRACTEKELAACALWSNGRSLSPQLAAMKAKVNEMADGSDEGGSVIDVTPNVVTASPGDEGKF